MEAQIQQIVLLIATGFLLPLAYEGVRWLRKKANQNAFFEKLTIDDTLFEIAEDTIKTVVPDLVKAGATLDNVQRKRAFKQLAERMKAHGVNVWKTHGEKGVQEVLDQALAAVKHETGERKKAVR